MNKPLDEPLTMTVHSLPEPGNETIALDAKRQSMGRWKMLALVVICAAPVIASYFMYYVVQPKGGATNYGALILPPKPMPALNITRLDGTNVPLASLKDQWLIVSVAGGACDSACEKNIYWQRQLREVMGRDKDRIERVWLVSDNAPVATKLAPQVHAPLNDAQAFRMKESDIATWLAPESGKALRDHLYVVDPQGNWMMRWPADMDASKAKRDIHKLLRASGSWDQAGRTAK